MDKNAIKKYAVWARRELISRVSQRAALYGITEKDAGDANATSVNGHVLSETEKKQRQALIGQIHSKGYEQVMEEVAYTWFNRFSALRFMEVNGYLPSHVRVFTDDENAFKPQILTEAINLEIDGIDMEKVYALKNANDNDELFKYLIIVQCNALSEILPGMFQKIDDYTELLFPDNLLREGSVLHKLIIDIEQDDFNVKSEDGQLEIIGWLYQYYISEKHEAVIDPIHGKIIEKDDVPAATQLFTTDWVVRFIVDNSVGRYWVTHTANSDLPNKLQYWVENCELRKDDNANTLNPKSLTVLDPCVGSGHFIVYAFDVLIKIYTEYGYTEREAAAAIVKNNIFGIDIDERAAQLAYFSIMMKGRQYDSRFFRRGIQPNILAIPESNSIDPYAVEYFCNGNTALQKAIKRIIKEFDDAKEYGSLLSVKEEEWEPIFSRIEEVREDINIVRDIALQQIVPLVNAAKIMSKKYKVVVTNPPYMNKYSDKLRDFLNTNLKDYSGDLFSAFMYRNFGFCTEDGLSGFMTPSTWMAAKQYEALREYIYCHKGIDTFVQMAKGAFFKEATVDVCAFVLNNKHNAGNGMYIRLDDFKGDMDYQNTKVLEALKMSECPYIYSSATDEFAPIPGKPIAYWISREGLEAFSRGLIGDVAVTKQGFKTGNNDLFLRLWYEVSLDNVFFGGSKSQKRWFPCNKGGNYRKWYGNKEYAVDWKNDGYQIINYKDKKGKQLSRPQNISYNFREALTWSTLSSGPISFRFSDSNMMFESKGSECFVTDPTVSILDIQGYLNSCVCMYYLAALAPTVDYSEGSILKLPFIKTENTAVSSLVQDNIALSKWDWDAYETSWDFSRHPLVRSVSTVSEAYELWESECSTHFSQLKSNEEEINRIFIDIYGLQEELTPEVEDKDVTIRRADLQRDVKSLISYAVGCMFGRYSLDTNGLVYAGGEWDESKYSRFTPDKDAILPICDDEYFTDDIVGRFVEFVRVVYGSETLDDNLKFIADALGGKGQPKDVIRNYFLNDFFADHLKVYQKRPIYWQFDSGKKGGFKALVYMHRYASDTVARIRTDYVHEQQSRYRTAIADLQNRIANAGTSERVKLSKQLKTLQEQDEEIRIYEEKIHHLADQMIAIDLDDGVKVNYAKFQDVLAKIK